MFRGKFTVHVLVALGSDVVYGRKTRDPAGENVVVTETRVRILLSPPAFESTTPCRTRPSEHGAVNSHHRPSPLAPAGRARDPRAARARSRAPTRAAARDGGAGSPPRRPH